MLSLPMRIIGVYGPFCFYFAADVGIIKLSCLYFGIWYFFVKCHFVVGVVECFILV